MNTTVGQHIASFYKDNNFGEDGGVSKKVAYIKFGFINFPIPNLESRKNNVLFHDINHLITNNNTTWKGESAVSAFEIASGGWKNFYFPWVLTLWAMGLGVVFFTKSTLQSFKSGLTMKNALCSGLSKTEILNYPVKNLVTLVSNQPKSQKNLFLWTILSLFVFLIPFVLIATVFYLLIKI